jgi:hypothetical protein
MTVFRRRLRSLATTWVLFQAVALSALVPPSCCLGHTNPSTPVEKVAETSSPPCAMHHAQANAHQHSVPAARKPARECAMRAACGGQAAALFAALSHTAVLRESIAFPDTPSAAAPPSSLASLILQFQPPDAPPPRASAFATASARLSSAFATASAGLSSAFATS